jgi:hypothetical protein
VHRSRDWATVMVLVSALAVPILAALSLGHRRACQRMWT